ncbi:3-hydroxyisobutyrate dehydrogenase, partial [Bordetella hinzii L60]
MQHHRAGCGPQGGRRGPG